MAKNKGGENRFILLKKRLHELGLQPRSYLAEQLNMPVDTLNKRMTAEWCWRLNECYKLMDLINAPYSDIYKYFPPEDLGLIDYKKELLTMPSSEIIEAIEQDNTYKFGAEVIALMDKMTAKRMEIG